jgi:hypothetical protein
MEKVVQMTLNEVEQAFRDLANEARSGKVTYFYCLTQREHEDYVEWQPIVAGTKSYDSQHLLAEIGHYYVVTQAVFEEICELAEEEDESID